MRIGILSDDLTGAGDVGIPFAALGGGVTLEVEPLSWMDLPSCGVLVLNTEARASFTPEEAIEDGLKALKQAGCDFFYLKLDSCLRGDIGTMIDVFVEGLDLSEILFVPAFPHMGRTTKNGVQLLYGKPVHLTDIARDPKHPIRESHIPTLLERSCRNARKVHIPNVKSSEDLMRLAKEILEAEKRAVVASAGLAHAIAGILPLTKKQGEAGSRKGRSVYSLVVSGSANPVSLRQMERLKSSAKNGWRFVDAWASGGVDPKRGGGFVKALQDCLRDGRVNRLVLVGGETASISCEALGISRLKILGETAPGCALCEVVGKPYEIVLKPGGFGDENTLMRCLE